MKRPRDEPFFVEVYAPGDWAVIDGEGDPVGGVLFDTEEDADEISAALNDAYWRGRESAKRKRRKS
jgi:hypothetical protein